MKKSQIVNIFSSFTVFFILVSNMFLNAQHACAKVGIVTGLPIPRFVIIKSRDANIRSGPGITHSATMNYKCIFNPLLVKAEFDNWRLVQDIYGNEGWIHEAMIDGQKYVQIKPEKTLNRSDAEVVAYRLPDTRSNPVARAEAGTILKLLKCKDDWCKLSFGSKNKGWVQKNKLWGVVE